MSKVGGAPPPLGRSRSAISGPAPLTDVTWPSIHLLPRALTIPVRTKQPAPDAARTKLSLPYAQKSSTFSFELLGQACVGMRRLFVTPRRLKLGSADIWFPTMSELLGIKQKQ